MTLKVEIQEKLAELLSGKLDLESFEDWLVQHSWNMHLDSDPAAQDLAAAVELALAEHSSGHLSDDELRRELHSLLEQVVASPRSAVSR